MATTKLRAAATALNKGAKELQAISRQIRALDALAGSLTPEQTEEQFSAIVGSLRAFRSVTLQEVINALSAEVSTE